ncbi:hypothetical protein BCR35DRAFT_304961 [Leucosporidium creatinivorum]|uniref:Uncharacterized protein n=1 Tax=Leucosporidium creatinivorum TaxID=106004 RepID=A0A1Y2F7P0_9BASI|nr:hypothetical protein BCR35DRAFT_304961 [Leucosporidium creatinivorum]
MIPPPSSVIVSIAIIPSTGVAFLILSSTPPSLSTATALTLDGHERSLLEPSIRSRGSLHRLHRRIILQLNFQRQTRSLHLS